SVGPSGGLSEHPGPAVSEAQRFKRLTSPAATVPVVDDGEVSPGAEADDGSGGANRQDFSGFDGAVESAEGRLRSSAKRFLAAYEKGDGERARPAARGRLAGAGAIQSELRTDQYAGAYSQYPDARATAWAPGDLA